MNDHQTWSAKVLDKFIDIDPFICRKHKIRTIKWMDPFQFYRNNKQTLK